MNEDALFEKLDKIISLLEISVKEPSMGIKIANGIATGVGIMSIIAIIDIIKSWLGG